MNDDAPTSHGNDYGTDQPTPQEAEATLREAIAAYDARPVREDLHTADALVWALQRRQWLSHSETEDLREHLAGILSRLRGIPRPRLASSDATDPERRTVRKRPVAVAILLAHVADSAVTPLDGVLDAVVTALTTPAGVHIDGDRLRQALKALTHGDGSGEQPHPGHVGALDSSEQRPQSQPDAPGSGEQRREGQPDASGGSEQRLHQSQAETLDTTLAAFRHQFTQSADHAALRLATFDEESSSEPAWVLWVLIDALRDSAWLTEAHLAGLRDEIFSHVGLDAPQSPPPTSTPPADLDPTITIQLTDTAARIAQDAVEQVADLSESEPEGVAHLLLDAIAQIARGYPAVGTDSGTDSDDAMARLRRAVDAALHGDPAPVDAVPPGEPAPAGAVPHSKPTPADAVSPRKPAPGGAVLPAPPPPMDTRYSYTPAEQEELAQDVVDALTTRLDKAAGTAGLTGLLADALEEVAEIFGAEVDAENLRTAFAARWPEDY